MPTRTASAQWEGDIKTGSGRLETESGAVKSQYSFQARFESGKGTNPEELIGAAEAGCMAMALSKTLGDAGHPPERVDVSARVELGQRDGTPTITRIELTVRARAEGLDEKALERLAGETAKACPVSRALAGTEVVIASTEVLS